MKFRLFYLLLLFTTGLLAQTPDSVAIRQVDSLIKESRDFTVKNELDKAFEVNAVAE